MAQPFLYTLLSSLPGEILNHQDLGYNALR